MDWRGRLLDSPGIARQASPQESKEPATEIHFHLSQKFYGFNTMKRH